jgi:hypothetical protein
MIDVYNVNCHPFHCYDVAWSYKWVEGGSSKLKANGKGIATKQLVTKYHLINKKITK